MTQATKLEKFLKNEPLTEELRALASGEEDLEQKEPEAEPSSVISDDDREVLRRMKYEGLPILLRLMDEHMEAEEYRVRQMSLNNPLGNKDAIAESWAYVAMQKRLRLLMTSIVDAEIARIERTDEHGA